MRDDETKATVILDMAGFEILEEHRERRSAPGLYSPWK
jgi:hypothetical protein